MLMVDGRGEEVGTVVAVVVDCSVEEILVEIGEVV